MRTIIVMLAGWVIGMVFLAPASAWAVHPFQVEDTNVQGKGNFLLELNGDYSKKSDFKKTMFAGVFNAGVSSSVDLALQVPYLNLDPNPDTDLNARGIGDIELRLKQRIYENEVNQSFGYQLYTDLPTGNSDEGLGTNNVVVGFKLMDQQGCCSTIYHVSLGYQSFAKDMKDRHFTKDSAIQFGFALEHKLTESFRLLSELSGEIRKGKEVIYGTHPFTFMAGFKYDISKSWYADFAARAGLNSDAEDYTTLIGVAWRF